VKKIQIIAEAGVNHNGNIDKAIELINVASDAGADFVKFQTFIADKIITKNASKAEYQINNSLNKSETQLEMAKKLELSFDDHILLKEYCNEKKIKFLSTAFDLESIDWIKKLKVPFFKVPSGEITNLPYLRKAAIFFSRFVVSTGMCNINEVESALNVLIENNIIKKNITLLHCTTEYPTPFEYVNLNVMTTLKEKFNVDVGYSDHTEGIEVPIAAAAMGASIIEKHFTLDKNMEGPDHKASLNPEELRNMIKSIRMIEVSLGSHKKSVTIVEEKNKHIARKSIIALRPIKIGDTFSDKNLTCKRPGDGISPMEWDKIIGEKSRFNFKIDDKIKL
jgi:N,N'-diacetyllegionaminate synthase